METHKISIRAGLFLLVWAMLGTENREGVKDKGTGRRRRRTRKERRLRMDSNSNEKDMKRNGKEMHER